MSPVSTYQLEKTAAPEPTPQDGDAVYIPFLIRELKKATGPSRKPVPEAIIQKLVIALGSDSFDEREAAHNKLEEIGYAAKSEIKKALTDPDAEIRRHAASLWEPLKESDEERAGFMTYPIQALGARGAASKDAVSVLIDALEVDEPFCRAAVIHALKDIGPASKVAVPQLIAALKDKHDNVRESAAYALGALGSDAKDALPALTALAEAKEAPNSSASGAEKNNRAAKAAADSLRKIKDALEKGANPELPKETDPKMINPQDMQQAVTRMEQWFGTPGKNMTDNDGLTRPSTPAMGRGKLQKTV